MPIEFRAANTEISKWQNKMIVCLYVEMKCALYVEMKCTFVLFGQNWITVSIGIPSLLFRKSAV